MTTSVSLGKLENVWLWAEHNELSPSDGTVGSDELLPSDDADVTHKYRTTPSHYHDWANDAFVPDPPAADPLPSPSSRFTAPGSTQAAHFKPATSHPQHPSPSPAARPLTPAEAEVAWSDPRKRHLCASLGPTDGLFQWPLSAPHGYRTALQRVLETKWRLESGRAGRRPPGKPGAHVPQKLDAAPCTLPSLTGALKHHSASHTEPISNLENGVHHEPGQPAESTDQLCEASTGTLGADDVGEAWIAVPPDLSLSLGLAESGRPSTTPGPLPIDPCQLAERAVSAGTYATGELPSPRAHQSNAQRPDADQSDDQHSEADQSDAQHSEADQPDAQGSDADQSGTDPEPSFQEPPPRLSDADAAASESRAAVARYLAEKRALRPPTFEARAAAARAIQEDRHRRRLKCTGRRSVKTAPAPPRAPPPYEWPELRRYPWGRLLREGKARVRAVTAREPSPEPSSDDQDDTDSNPSMEGDDVRDIMWEHAPKTVFTTPRCERPFVHQPEAPHMVRNWFHWSQEQPLLQDVRRPSTAPDPTALAHSCSERRAHQWEEHSSRREMLTQSTFRSKHHQLGCVSRMAVASITENEVASSPAMRTFPGSDDPGRGARALPAAAGPVSRFSSHRVSTSLTSLTEADSFLATSPAMRRESAAVSVAGGRMASTPARRRVPSHDDSVYEEVGYGHVSKEGLKHARWRGFTLADQCPRRIPTELRTSGGWTPAPSYMPVAELYPRAHDELISKAYSMDTQDDSRELHEIHADTVRLVRDLDDQETVEVDMSHSLVGPRHMTACVKFFSSYSTSNIHLKLRSTHLQDEYLVQMFKTTWPSVLLMRLACLDLSCNEFTWRGVQALASAMPVLVCLQELVLHKNNLGDKGAQCLALTTINCPSLAKLDLSSGDIREAGARAVGNMMLESAMVSELNFSGNRLGVKGGFAFGSFLQSGALSLSTLHLACNGLSDRACSHIAGALAENTALAFLDLSGNTLGAVTCRVLKESLKVNRTLRTVLLCNNPLGFEGVAAAIQAANDSATLTRLGLDECGFVALHLPAQSGHRTRNVALDFDPTDPNGFYDLEISDPGERLVALQLCQLRALMMNRPDAVEVWKKPLLDGKLVTDEMAKSWVSMLPPRGQLSLEFLTKQRLSPVADPIDASVLERLLQKIGLTEPSHKDDWKLDIIRVLASLFFFNTMCARRLLQSLVYPQEKVQACVQLFARVTDPHNLDDMTDALEPKQQAEVAAILGPLSRFCPNNPTGRYKLVLGRTLDYMIARRLVSIYQEEFAKGLVEVDGRTTTCFNNATLDSKPFLVTDPYEWKLPRQGLLCLDFISYTKADPEAKILSREGFAFLLYQMTFNKGEKDSVRTLIREVYDITGEVAKGGVIDRRDLKQRTIFQSLMNKQSSKAVDSSATERKVVSQFAKESLSRSPVHAGRGARAGVKRRNGVTADNILYYSSNTPSSSLVIKNPGESVSILQGVVGMGNFFFVCRQMRSLVALYKTPAHRIMTAVLLFRRLLDPHNFARVLRLLPDKEQAEIGKRLGYINIFHPAEPGMYYLLDLKNSKDREVAYKLYKMAWADDENHKNMLNLTVDGRPKNITEDEKLWLAMCGMVEFGKEPRAVVSLTYWQPYSRESAALTIQIWWRMMSSHLKILRAVRMQDKFKKIAGMAHTLKGDGDEMVDAAWK